MDLAFDAGWGQCDQAIDWITIGSGERLLTAGLGEERILALGRRAPGDNQPFTLTLVAVDTGRVRAWTGPQKVMTRYAQRDLVTSM